MYVVDHITPPHLAAGKLSVKAGLVTGSYSGLFAQQINKLCDYLKRGKRTTLR